MENGAFAPKEQMLHFPLYFQIYDISKVVKRRYYGWSKGFNTLYELISDVNSTQFS